MYIMYAQYVYKQIPGHMQELGLTVIKAVLTLQPNCWPGKNILSGSFRMILRAEQNGHL